MKPRIYLHKGFVMLDPQDNTKLLNKLSSSSFLTPHPKGRIYYCMANNYGIKFLRAFKPFLESNFEISEDIQKLMRTSKIQYMPHRKEQLKKITFKGITFKDHQNTALDYIRKYKRYCIFLGPGTGKTLIALATLKMLNKPGKYLIVTPKKAIDQYKTEIEKYLKDFPGEIFVTNYESLSKYEDKGPYVCFILDESHRCKNISSQMNESACKIAKDSENVYCFTGTPQDKHRDEVLAQLKILNENLYSVKYLLMERFFELDDYYNPVKEKRPDELKEIIECCSYGEKTEDIIELPKEEEYVIPCDLNEIRSTYLKFKKDKVLKGKSWLALGDSPAKHRSKLTQMCSGFIIDEDGIAHDTPYNPKENGLIYLLGKCKQAIIYTCFDEEQKLVTEILKKHKKTFVCVNGKSKDSDESIKKFKDGTVDYLVIQIVSGNAALDFPHINNIIYYSLHDSYIYYEQSKYRIKRIGQKKPCIYYYLIVKGTVEVSRLAALKRKRNFNNREFEIYRRRTKYET